jgi:hypothetical protein
MSFPHRASESKVANTVPWTGRRAGEPEVPRPTGHRRWRQDRCLAFGGCHRRVVARTFGTLGDTPTTYRKKIVSSEDPIVAGLNGRDPERRARPAAAGRAEQITPSAGGVGRLPASMVTPAATGNLPDVGTAVPDYDGIDETEDTARDDEEQLAAADADVDAPTAPEAGMAADAEPEMTADAEPEMAAAPVAEADVVAAADMLADAGRRLINWARARALSPTSVWGISVALAFCATAWFSAGTRVDNFHGAAALWASYLMAIAGRKMIDWPQAGLPRLRGTAAWREATRTRWLGTLAWSMSECAIYAGLAAGAAAERWRGAWTLAVAVVGVVAIRDLMSAICATTVNAEDGVARGSGVSPGSAWSAIWRTVDKFLSMPTGGRVLLVGIVAPAWGCRTALLALIDWGVISIVYGLAARPGSAGTRVAGSVDEQAADGARSRGRWRAGRRSRRAQDRQAEDRQAEGGEEPAVAASEQDRLAGGSLVVLLQPGQVEGDGLNARDAAAEARTEAAGAALAEETEAALAEVAESGRAEPAPGEVGPGYGDPEAEEAGEIEAEQAAEAIEVVEAAEEIEAEQAAEAAEAAGAAKAAAQRAASLRVGRRTRQLRDDGAIARLLGELVRGNFVPLPPAILGLVATVTLTYLGIRSLPAILILSPPLIMLLAAPGSSNPHTGRLDWLTPAVLLGWQILYLAAIGVAASVPGPATFTLCAVLLLRYTDLAFPGRPVAMIEPKEPGEQATERGTMLGWEGRMLLMGAGVAIGVGMYAYLAMAAYLGMLICAKILTSCLGAQQGDGR